MSENQPVSVFDYFGISDSDKAQIEDAQHAENAVIYQDAVLDEIPNAEPTVIPTADSVLAQQEADRNADV